MRLQQWAGWQSLGDAGGHPARSAGARLLWRGRGQSQLRHKTHNTFQTGELTSTVPAGTQLGVGWHLALASVPAYISGIIPNTRMQDTVRELRCTRNDTITELPARTHGYYRSFIPNTTKQWNKLSEDLRQAAANPVRFKKQLRRERAPKPANSYFAMGSKRGNYITHPAATKCLSSKGSLVLPGQSRLP